ncbi:hypothetical protein N7449_010972 [Penicillium cf. viridicatum]|uniref:Uncharacterized protein n=1 Tax=Penicillium cf. viridicatum TaxID=2972119 RepID=A0A9W9IW69_9EURO|nr:hypothetical protein N7449_010972 [Penicillium cf. viridicatum]
MMLAERALDRPSVEGLVHFRQRQQRRKIDSQQRPERIGPIHGWLNGYAHLKVKKPNKAQDWVTYANQNKIFFEGNSHCHEPVIILDDTEDEGMITTLQEQFQ